MSARALAMLLAIVNYRKRVERMKDESLYSLPPRRRLTIVELNCVSASKFRAATTTYLALGTRDCCKIEIYSLFTKRGEADIP